MVRILVAGNYDSYLLTYHCIAEYEDGKRERICGTFTGSQIETQINAVSIALKYAMQKRLEATIFTHFKEVIAYINTGWTPQIKRIKEFMNYVNKVNEFKKITFSSDVPDDLNDTYIHLRKLLGDFPTRNPNVSFKEGHSQWKRTIPQFRVVLYDRYNQILLNLDNNDFGEDIRNAIDFCDWYDEEVLNEKSTYYGCRIIRYNLPPKKSVEPQKADKPIEHTAPVKTEEPRINVIENVVEQVAF